MCKLRRTAFTNLTPSNRVQSSYDATLALRSRCCCARNPLRGAGVLSLPIRPRSRKDPARHPADGEELLVVSC